MTIGKPPLKKNTKGTPPPSTKGAPPALNEVSVSNLTKLEAASDVPLNFKVPPEFRRDMKGYATEKDLSMKEVLIKAFNDFKKNNP